MADATTVRVSLLSQTFGCRLYAMNYADKLHSRCSPKT